MSGLQRSIDLKQEPKIGKIEISYNFSYVRNYSTIVVHTRAMFLYFLLVRSNILFPKGNILQAKVNYEKKYRCTFVAVEKSLRIQIKEVRSRL